MGKKQLTIYFCDKCKAEFGDCNGIRMFSRKVGSKTDAAGSSESVIARVELCHVCTAKILQEVVAQWKNPEFEEFVKANGGEVFP